MNNLEILKTTQTISSVEVAGMMEKEHKEVMYMIEGNDKRGIVGIKPTLEMSAELHLSDYFIESSYKDSMNRAQKCYECTKMGCDMLANKLNGEKGILFTAKYVKKFNDLMNGQPLISQEMNAKMDKVIDDANYLKSVVHIKKLDATVYSKHIKRYLGIKTINEDKVGYGTIRDMFFLEMGVTKFEDIEVNKDNLLILEQCCREYKKPWEQLSFNI